MSSIHSFWQRLVQFLNESPMASITMEVGIRLLLLIAFVYAEFTVAETHFIQPEDMWRYRYPYKDSKVPYGELCLSIIASAAVVFYVFGRRKKYHGVSEYGPATLGITCSMFITGVITNILKSVVGRPRPNYLYRCYGPKDYLFVKDTTDPCISSEDVVGDLRKSFPSGHSSTAFSGLVYLALYMAGKLGTFNSKGRGCMWRLTIPIIPVFVASWVAATRYTDYHHHFDDILTGSLLGTFIAYISYRIYYPSLEKEFCQFPYKWLALGILSQQQPRSAVTRSPHRRQARQEMDERGVAVEPLIGSLNHNSPRSNSRLLDVAYNNSNINMTVYASRSSSIMNNAELSAQSRASIAFYWDEEDLDENGQPVPTPQDIDTMRQELISAFVALGRPSVHENTLNGNVTID